MSVLRKTLSLAGRDLIVETGRVAGQAGGSVLASYGDTVVLVTATASAEPREGIDFFPLTVDYEERHYAVGRIPGGFIKREGRPSEKAILSARLIDRPIRPLFPSGYRNDVHVVATILSVDQDNPPDVLAVNGASAALTLSEIPFGGPIGCVLVGLVDDELVVNPTLQQQEKSRLHLVVAGTREAVMMVEAGAEEVPEEVVLEAIALGHREIQRIVDFLEDLRQEALNSGLAKEKQSVTEPVLPAEWEEDLAPPAEDILRAALESCLSQRADKKAREQRLEEAKQAAWEKFLELSGTQEPDEQLGSLVKAFLDKLAKNLVRQIIVNRGLRPDGRRWEEIRPISCEVGVLPRTHGSALFTRGETQVLTVATLGAVSDEQILDGLGVEESKRFMHHYNMPPYSTGEARPIRAPSRREIGHGALAERALERVLPGEEEFPYTIRLVSEVLSSNGSTSMASVCGSTLALMDAGVPIKAPVAGIAMGLVKEGDATVVLSDIQGLEDALGDMDFKVAGTEKGICALQMDIKVPGIGTELLARALEQARRGRLEILQKMLAVIDKPRPEISPLAPRILRIKVDPDKIRDIIGPGGKIIKKIIDETGAKIDIEDDGTVFIAAADGEAGRRTVEIIEALTKEVEIGQIYTGRVTRTTDFGAFVEIIPGVLGLPGKEGLVHISQLAEGRVGRVEDVVKQGEEILVKAIGFDPQGRLRLSRREAVRAEVQPDKPGGYSRVRPKRRRPQ
ncbi:MAG: polyribonucleotide nucleotidyltransferase [Clostridia bacterium]|jgi:polyribonucleotide nucleotidyltransferase|nr:polyribonucleotide nucleotidyltransferase [Clostridia bacterium]MDH7572373.1 polyribonucleotide nucleotidyltransferase [Clostridia bacterium]